MSFFRMYHVRLLAALLLILLPLGVIAQRKKKNRTVLPVPESPNLQYQTIGGPMPPIRAVYPGKAVYTTQDVQNDANLFVMLFHPTCDHCHEMAIKLGQSLPLFQKSNILMMAAPNMAPYLEYFENSTHISKYPAIRVGLDSADFLQKTFRYQNLPQVNVYSPDGKLLNIFNGLSTIDSLKPYIQ